VEFNNTRLPPRSPDVVRAAGAPGGGLPGGPVLPDGPVPLHEGRPGHHPQPGHQAGAGDGEAHQQLPAGLRLLRGQEHVPLLLHGAQVPAEPLQRVGPGGVGPIVVLVVFLIVCFLLCVPCLLSVRMTCWGRMSFPTGD